MYCAIEDGMLGSVENKEGGMVRSRLLMYAIWPQLPLRHQIPALLTLVFGLVTTLFLFCMVQHWEKQRVDEVFNLHVELAVQTLQSAIQNREIQLLEHAALLGQSGEDDVQDLKERFLKTEHDFTHSHPGLVDHALVVLTPGAAPDVLPSSQHAGHLALEPGDFTTGLLPLAQGVEMESSRPFNPSDSGEKDVMIRYQARVPGVFVGERQAYVVSMVSIRMLMASALGRAHDSGLDFLITDHTMTGSAYVFDLRRRSEQLLNTAEDSQLVQTISERVHRISHLNFGQREVTTLVAPTAGFMQMQKSQWRWWVLSGGILFTVLLADYSLMLVSRVAEFERVVRDHNCALTSANQELARQLTKHNDAASQLNKLTQAVESSPIAMVITQEAGIIEYVNLKYTQMTGFEKTEMLGRSERLLESDRLQIEEKDELRKAMRRGREWSSDFTDESKTGELIHQHVSVAPIRNRAGEITHFVFMHSDETDKRRLREQFLQSQKMEVIGRLAGGVVHDLSNMLTVILGFSQIVQSQLPEDDPLMEDIEEIIRVGERAASLNKQLLAFARTQSHQSERMDANEAVLEMDKFLHRTLGEDVVLDSELRSQPCIIKIDPGQFNQLIMNLAVNARDAMPDGGKLTVKTSEADLPAALCRIHGLKAERYMLLSVADTGTGMSEEVRKHLFEPFFTTKAEGQGTGLGLSTVYGIVKRFDGAIEVLSKPDKGTEFRIYFPLCKSETETLAVAPKVAVPKGTETILVVEDDVDVLQLTITLLGGLGYSTIQACSGEAALEICSRQGHEIDLVITDVVMPGMNGLDLMSKIRALLPEMNIIFTTGFSEHPVLNRAMALDTGRLLRKPFTRAVLGRTVREAIDSVAPSVEINVA